MLGLQLQYGRPAKRGEESALVEGDTREARYTEMTIEGLVSTGTVIPGCGEQAHTERENTAAHCDVDACGGWMGSGSEHTVQVSARRLT